MQVTYMFMHIGDTYVDRRQRQVTHTGDISACRRLTGITTLKRSEPAIQLVRGQLDLLHCSLANNLVYINYYLNAFIDNNSFLQPIQTSY